MSRKVSHNSREIYWLLPVAFLLISGVLLGLMIYYYKVHQTSVKTEKYQYLQSISEIKEKDIGRWISERKGEARFTYNNKGFSLLVRTLAEEPDNLAISEELADWLEPMKKSHGYHSITVLATTGDILLRLGGDDRILQSCISEAIVAANENEIRMTNLTLDEVTKNLFMNMYVPVIDHDHGNILGAVIFRIDPETGLYPLLNQIPIPYKTIESYIVSRLEDEMVVVSRLRLSPHLEPFSIRLPADPEYLTDRINLKAQNGVITANDYRGRQVLVSISTTGHFDWVIITKVDTDEILAPLFGQRRQFLIMIFTVSALFALTFFFLNKSKQSRHYRQIYHKEIEKQAIRSHYDYLRKHANDPIFLVETDGRIVEANDKALSTYGYTGQEILSLTISDIRAPETRGLIDEQLQKVVGSEGHIFETVHLKKDGSRFPVEISSRLIEIDGHKYFHSIIRDITDKKLAEEQITLAREIAEESSNLKSAILMNMSHELRTPLNGILGFAQLLSRRLKGSPEEVMVNHIITSGDRLLGTLSNILELAELESDKTQVSIQHYDLKDIGAEVAGKFIGRARSKGLDFVNNISHSTPVRVDRKMLIQAIDQIVDNAIKFTDSGIIELSAGFSADQGIRYTNIHIADTGIGIPGNKTKTIFKEFSQVSQGYHREYEGTGVGLSLVKKMVVLMHGTVTVASKQGSGTTFTLSFPSGEITPLDKTGINTRNTNIKVSAADHRAESPPDILVVEDNASNSLLIAEYLKGLVNIEIAPDGYTALEMAGNKQYDIILMDINLGPGIDGLETTGRLRKIPGYDSTPVVAVTGYTMTKDREKVYRHGCSHFLGKPFTQEDLMKLLSEITGSAALVKG